MKAKIEIHVPVLNKSNTWNVIFGDNVLAYLKDGSHIIGKLCEYDGKVVIHHPTNLKEVDYYVYPENVSSAYKHRELSEITGLSYDVLRKQEGLDVSRCGLDSFPHGLNMFGGLRTLLAQRNKLASLPDLSALCWLEEIDLSRNKFEEFPVELYDCVNLADIRLSHNNLKLVPSGIEKLVNLAALELGSNNINVIPNCLCGLKSLELLDLSGNGIKEIPQAISGLESLEILDLSHNPINTIPNSIKELKKLTRLILHECHLSIDEQDRIQKLLPDVTVIF